MRNKTNVIHVVDDDPGIRASLHRLFVREGYRTQLYSSGKEFIEKYDNTPGCVILDLAMPMLSGDQVLQKIISGRFNLTVLILTGHATIDVAIKLIKAGASDLLEKPFSNDDIVHRVQTLLKSASTVFAKNELIIDYNNRISLLTSAERAVMELLVTGMTSKEIANYLGNSKRTIDIHRARIMKKTGAATTKELLEDWIRLAHENNS